VKKNSGAVATTRQKSAPNLLDFYTSFYGNLESKII